MSGLLRRALGVIGVLLLTSGLVAGVVNREVLDARRFAAHVDQVRADPHVADALGELISDAVIDEQPELVAVRPLLESVASSLVASDAMGAVVRTSAVPLHAALVTGDSTGVLFRLADIGALLVAALETLAPEQAAVLPNGLDVTLADVGAGDLGTTFVDQAHAVRLLSWLLPLLGVLALVGAGLLRSRSTGTRGPGDWLRLAQHVLAWTAGVLVLTIVLARWATARLGDDDLLGAVARAGWEELEAAVWRTVLVVALLALLAAVVRHPGLRLDEGSGARLRAWLSTRDLPLAEHTMRLGVLAAAGALLLLHPVGVLRTAVLLVGVGLLALALRDALVVAAVGIRRVAPALADRAAPLVAQLRGRTAVVAGVALLAGLITLGAWPGSESMPVSAAAPGACNGHRELCERRYDEVSHAATHNSMAAADEPGWFLSEQPTGLVGQLDDGVRALLIDTWPGQVTSSGVVANTEASRAEGLAQAEAEFGKPVVASALRLRGSLNLTPVGPEEPFLCHGLCELGSTPLVSEMRKVRTWMDNHPREVVTLFIQDAITPQATAQAFDEADLTDLAHTQTAGAPWPTLAEMIDSGRRLVVIHENRTDPAVPWILASEVFSQDTPYSFRRIKDFTCELYRGSPDAPLFLVNHWLSNKSSRIADADRVNATGVLLTRMQQCTVERGQQVTYVAVNNYDRGDLFSVVDTLNGF